MNQTILILTIILTGLFSSGLDGEKFKVEYKGALRDIMHKGDISAKADLKDLNRIANLYALGAVEDLKGEILIIDSKPYISSVNKSELSISNSLDHKATLLVYCSVNKWKTLPIPSSIESYSELEKFIAQAAQESNIDINSPFPFLINGTASSVDWHVIDWKEGDTEHSHEKHISSGLNGTLKNEEIEILGFYSNSHHAIFTHHTTNMHLHLKTKDNSLSGHVDAFSPGKQMTLMIPAVK